MKEVVCIGDVHGKTGQYQKIIRQKYLDTPTIQLGDMGIGFPETGLHKMADHHKWFRGNHDNPAKCRKTHNYMGDYGYDWQRDIFWLAGAFSIDREWRVAGVSWWPDEELSYNELSMAIDLYGQVQPKFVVSHEAPARAGRAMLDTLMGPYFSAKAECCMSRTSEALQQMFQLHQPKEWVFGHYHVNRSFYVGDYPTKFTCVAELAQYRLELE